MSCRDKGNLVYIHLMWREISNFATSWLPVVHVASIARAVTPQKTRFSGYYLTSSLLGNRWETSAAATLYVNLSSLGKLTRIY